MSNKSLAIDTERFKASAMDVCAGEANNQLKVSCLFSAMKRVEMLDSISSSKGGKNVISMCASSVNLNSKRGLYDLAFCAEKQVVMINNHPNPLWVGLDLNVKKLRTHWVSNCFSKLGHEVNKCVEKQYQGFNEFWNSYLKVSSKKEFENIYNCVEKDIFDTDFSKFKLCLEINNRKYTVTK